MLKIVKMHNIRLVMNKILIVFIIYVVTAASFNGFFLKWGFRDGPYDGPEFSFESMFNETAHRPFVHRQLMLTVAKGIVAIIPEEPLNELKYNKNGFYYLLMQIGDKPYVVAYGLVYWMCFWCLFASTLLWRKIFTELTENEIAGTVAACCFALLFPLFETEGGYFYDFGELLFFTLATFFALRGNWLALIIISPIAEYNKESYLFFVLTLVPLLAVKLEKKRAATAIIFAAFLSGLTYLYVSNLYAGNPGGSTQFHFWYRLANIANGWFELGFTYGILFGAGMFLPHVLLVAYIVKNSWTNLPLHWQNHIKLAAIINFPLYIFFCWIGELRNLSMLYMGFIALLALFIKKFVTKGGN